MIFSFFSFIGQMNLIFYGIDGQIESFGADIEEFESLSFVIYDTTEIVGANFFDQTMGDVTGLDMAACGKEAMAVYWEMPPSSSTFRANWAACSLCPMA